MINIITTFLFLGRFILKDFLENQELNIYDLVLGTLALFVLIAPLSGRVYDDENKRFTKKGWTIYFAFIASIVITLFKNNYIKEAEKQNKQIDDSIAELRTKKTSEGLVKSFTTTLERFHLHYDSTQNVITRMVKDSSKKVVNNYNKNEPELSISNIEVKSLIKDTLTLNISITSGQAKASNILIDYYSVAENKQGQFTFTRGEVFALKAGATLAADAGETIETQFFSYSDSIPYLHFIFKGTYTNQQGKKIKFSDFESLDIKNNNFGTLTPPNQRKRLLSFFKKHGVVLN